jgi:hypothetical protein
MIPRIHLLERRPHRHVVDPTIRRENRQPLHQVLKLADIPGQLYSSSAFSPLPASRVDSL